MKRLFWIMLALCAGAWCFHLYSGTLALRGFFGDGAMLILNHLSHSYLFDQPGQHLGRFVHLFAVGFPREFQFLLNAMALQLLLTLNVQSPAAFKYAFTFWQFALPGLLYLLLFWVLWRRRLTAWAVFPLVSWAVLSVPVDWNVINSTRWAVPIFWMYFYLVLFAGPQIKPWPLAGAVFFGCALLGGVYESVTLQCGLCLAVGGLMWWRERNRVPFLYALASIPGAIRAWLAYTENGHGAPNSFHGLALTRTISQPYFLLIALSFAAAIAIGLVPKNKRPIAIGVGCGSVVLAAVAALTSDFPSVWMLSEMRFDYVFLSMALMVWAAALRLYKTSPAGFALPAATLALFTGSVLWIMQSQQTFAWQDCRAAYDAQKGNQPLIVSAQFHSLMQASDKIRYTSQPKFESCIWDWSNPWEEVLTAPNGLVTQWSQFTFWQYFSFIEKDGQVYLHTNNWAMTTPSLHVSEADLPLKTMLYDLTPLYERLGLGPLFPRARCMPAEEGDEYWHDHLMSLDNPQRASMFVCPRE